MKPSLVLLAAFVVIGVVSLTVAGPLAPPAGPVADTVNTAEPRTPIDAQNTPGDVDATFVIDEPGSYVLTGNITGMSGSAGVRIEADNVSIDGNGFTITLVDATADDPAIDAGSNGDITLTDLNVVDGHVNMTGPRQAVDNVSVRNTPTQAGGIRVGSDSRVTRCRVHDTNSTGISAGEHSLIESCVVDDSFGVGISGGRGARIVDCVVSNCLSQGIRVQEGAIVSGCTVRDVGEGISVLAGGSLVEDCAGTTSSSGNNGTQFGIEARGDGNTVRNCTVDNFLEGAILIESGGVIEDCTVDVRADAPGTGSPGIVANGTDVRVVNNHVTGGSNLAFDINADGFFFAKNTSFGTPGDFSFLGSTRGYIGPITGLVAGPNSTLSNTNPWANFAR